MDRIPGARVGLLEKNTGLIAREWYRFLYSLSVLTGNGNNSVSLLDMQTAPAHQEDYKSRREVQPTDISVGASPFNYTNNTGYDANIIIHQGASTITAVLYTRDGTNFYNIGVIQGVINLPPYDGLAVYYTGTSPTMTLVPK